MKIIVMPKVGFCYGVERSITLTKELSHNDFPKPYYLLGMLVHNDIVNNDLINHGFKILNSPDEIDNIIEGTLISTAHGLRDDLKDKINKKNLPIIDTTCPIVLNNNRKILKYYQEGYSVIYIGKHNHQESNVIKEYIHLIENINDINNLNITNNNIVLTNQTTMSIYDIDNLSKVVLDKYPSTIIDTIICPATKERQDTLIKELEKHHDINDYWIIIGDKKSNNTNKLVEIVRNITNNYYFIDNKNDVNKINIQEDYNFYITSGTSTPNNVIEEIIEELKKNSI